MRQTSIHIPIVTGPLVTAILPPPHGKAFPLTASRDYNGATFISLLEQTLLRLSKLPGGLDTHRGCG